MSKQLRIWLFVLLSTLLTSTSLPAEGVITMTTTKAVGWDRIELSIEAKGYVSITGVQESARTDGQFKRYTLTSQTITIRGNITRLNCEENQLTSLNLSGCTDLAELNCYGNQLTSLDVSQNTALTELDCRSNQLTSLDVSGFTALTTLRCTHNQLTSLNVSGCTALPALDCSRNQLTSLNLSGCASLTKLDCSNNQLTRLDVSDCTALTELKCYKNRLKGEAMTQMVVGLSNRSEKESGSLYVVCDESDENNILRSDVLTAFRKNWRVFKYIVNTGKSVLYSGASDDDEIVMTITQEQYLEGGIRLAILADGDVTIEGVHEKRIFTDGSKHTYTLAGTQITIRGNVSELDCSKNRLTNIDVSKSTSLWVLECSDNELTSLDLSGCTFLTTLYCSSNPFTSINLSNCTSLKEFTWDEGRLTSLDVSGCTALTKLWCSRNQLTSLDVSGCTALTKLWCSQNQLTSLDVSGSTALTKLNCSNNQLSSLELPQNSTLTELDCSMNKLESLDLSACTRLESLECYINKIRGKAVAQLVESLPDRYGKEPGKFYFVYYSEYGYEENFCYRPAVGRANDKNWRPQKGHSSRYQDSWEDYFGVIDEGVVMMHTAQEVGSQITLTLEAKGDVAIDGVKGVPETDGKPHQYTLLSQDVTIHGYVTKLDCSGNKLTSLDLSTTVPLVELDCSNNQLTALDVSQNAAVTSLACYRNQIKGEAMAQLIKGLPQLPLRSTHLFGIVSNAPDEGNVFLKADVERVQDKGWSPMKWDEERQQYEPYAGKETETFAVTLTSNEHGEIDIVEPVNLKAVPYGTTLTVKATGKNAQCELTALTANGEDILATQSFVVKGATEVKATFVDHTGVETTVTQQVQLYPNPATDYVSVEGVAPASEVTLHSMTGQRLYAGRADSRGVLQIDLTPYADGVYLVCVAGETYRVVVRR